MIERLGIIGDVHAEHERLQQAIDHLHDLHVDCLVCTGDVVDGDGCADESVRLLREADVQTVRGNHDRWIIEDKARHVSGAHDRRDLSEATIGYLETLPTQRELDTVSGKLLLCHGVGDEDLQKVWPGTERMPVERSRTLDALIEAGDIRYLVNGHMHFRTMIHFENLTLINAGTLKGIHWPGFSMVDFGKEEITAFEFTEDGINVAAQQKLIEDHHVIWKDTQDFTGNWDPVRLF